MELASPLLEHHELIRRGPYRIVRHPIYTGMFGMLIASGLAYGHWLGLVIASGVVDDFGTVIRIRSEEKLLREQFGSEYDNYTRLSAETLFQLRGRTVVSSKILGSAGILPVFIRHARRTLCQRRGAGFAACGESRRLA